MWNVSGGCSSSFLPRSGITCKFKTTFYCSVCRTLSNEVPVCSLGLRHSTLHSHRSLDRHSHWFLNPGFSIQPWLHLESFMGSCLGHRLDHHHSQLSVPAAP